MSTTKEGSKPVVAGEEKLPEEKVVKTVDNRSPAAAGDDQITEERPVEIVHEIHGGLKDKHDAPKQD